jgi:hypothetical protein
MFDEESALGDQFLVNQLDIQHGFDLEHIQQFVTLWEMVEICQRTAPTPRPRPIKCNLKASLLLPTKTLFGKLGRLSSSFFCLVGLAK